MADRDLTAHEFWQLPPEERMKRCGELSDHEAFVMRLTDPALPASPPCNDCAYYLGYAKCRAYPKGIPAHQIDAVMEDRAIECGDGYHYTPKADSEQEGPHGPKDDPGH